MSKLGYVRVVLVTAYLALAAWSALTAYWTVYSGSLLASLSVGFALFVSGVTFRRGELVLYSWIWLAGNFIVVLAMVPGTSFLEVIFSSVLLYVGIDSLQFLEVVSPLGSGEKEGEISQAAGWALWKAHAFNVSLIGLFAGGATWAAASLASPVIITSNPTLTIGIVATVLVVFIAFLVYSPGTGRRLGEDGLGHTGRRP